MAKVKNCLFCGKEIKSGFLGIFGGDAEMLELGDTMYIDVCADCEKKYHRFAKNDKGRFEVKIDNIKRATKKKFSDKEIADMFLTYYEQAQIYKANCDGEKTSTSLGLFYDYNENGFFWPLEATTDYDSANDYFDKKLLKLDEDKSLKSPCAFTKNDISMIEYSVISDVEPIKQMNGFDSTIYSLIGIKLNDYTQMTYKPCFVKAVTITSYKGIFPNKKKIEQDILIQLEEFRSRIGATDIPIVKVKKFK